MSPFRMSLQALFASALLLAAGACVGPRTVAHRSGLMEYLYPNKHEAPQPKPGGARLQLPLRLGMAFVPPSSGSWQARRASAAIGEKPLLEIVKKTFEGRAWIQEVRLIPSAYLMSQGGFDNLAQVARMYGVDVVALVSLDQLQYTDPKWYSFAYVSIVGAYVLPGDANDTRTLIDAAVFHVPSKTFLLRAPGQSVVKGSSTLVNREERLRADSGRGLELAMADLAGNLVKEVDAFKASVATGERQDIDVIDRQGQSLRATGGVNHGGAFGLEVLAGLALVALAGSRKRRP